MPGRRKMDIDTALMLARKIESQKREMGDPNVDGPRENDPMRVLQDQFYRGFNVPPGTEEQKQAYRDAIDQRLYTQGLRERRRAEAMAPSTRVLIADALRRGGLAASLTPYDVGLGDAAYAAGELIDPEGTYEDAALAAAGGALTGGLGSGAILSKAAKEARAMQKAADRADDFEDITPTVIKENPTISPKAKQIRDQLDEHFFFDTNLKPPGTFSMGSRIDPRVIVGPDIADIQSKIARSGRGPGPGPFGATLPEAIGMGTLAGVGGTMLATGTTPMEVQSRLLESIRDSSDYGNAFSETMRMNTPDMYNSPEDLNDVGPMLQEAYLKAFRISAQTGTVPIDLTRQIGKLEALQKTKETLEASDDLALQGGFMDPLKSGFGGRMRGVRQSLRDASSDEAMKTSGFGDRVEDGRSIEEMIRSRDEAVSRAELRDLQRMGIIDSPSLIDREVQFKPSMPIDEGPPMVGPADPTPEQMRQMDATREIVPSMEDFGE